MFALVRIINWYDVHYGASYQEAQYRAQWSFFFEPYSSAQSAFEEGEYLVALPLVDEALRAVTDSVHFDSVLVAQAYQLKARTHLSLWHFVEAEQTLKVGVSYASGLTHEELTYQLEKVQGRIENNDKERHEETVYLALRGLGPARALLGKILVVYVLIDDGVESTWGSRHRTFALAGLNKMQSWIQQQALQYEVGPPSFEERVFHYSKDPWLRSAVRAIGNDNMDIGYDLAKRVAELHGARTVNDMLYQMADEADADQAILLLHVAKKERSFARRCGQACSGKAEYAYLLKKPARNHWDAVPYVQAHEALHLFGADDLYNIQGARYYSPHDVMHRASKYLDASSIDSLSAFAIGWTHMLPPTPFPVKIYGRLP